MSPESFMDNGQTPPDLPVPPVMTTPLERATVEAINRHAPEEVRSTLKLVILAAIATVLKR